MSDSPQPNSNPEDPASQFDSLTSEIRFGRPTTILGVVGAVIVVGVLVMSLLPRRSDSVADGPAKDPSASPSPDPAAAAQHTIEPNSVADRPLDPTSANAAIAPTDEEPPATNKQFWTETNDQLRLVAQQHRALRDSAMLLESTIQDLLQSKTGRSIATQSNVVQRFMNIHYRRRMTADDFETIRVQLERWHEQVESGLQRPRQVAIDHTLSKQLSTLREEMMNSSAAISSDLQTLQSMSTEAASVSPGVMTLAQTIAEIEAGPHIHRDPATLNAEQLQIQVAREEAALVQEIDRRVKKAEFGRRRTK